MFYKFKKGVPSIEHYDLIKFLTSEGFLKMNFNGSNLLVRIIDNIIYEVNEGDITAFIKDYLLSQKEPVVLEVFTRGISSYVNSRKLQLLEHRDFISDKDQKDSAWTYFANVAVKVTSEKIEVFKYPELKHTIWNTRILNRNFEGYTSEDGQFSDFAFKLSKSNGDRFVALQTCLGYLQHRYINPSLCKAVILLDENISDDGKTNGGTGKSLLYVSLSNCKEAVIIEGKNLKSFSRFKNQRIKITTDIVNYDDLSKEFSLEELYSMLTTGVIVERKGKDELQLRPQDSPKIMMSSNYRVSGPGGSSDKRRRYEFEVTNYFNDEKTPVMEYGNLFFEEWNSDEWQKFDSFMLLCIQQFLKLGLIEPETLNPLSNLQNSTCEEFVEFISKNPIEPNVFINKEGCLNAFRSDYPYLESTTSNSLTKWMKLYSKQSGLEYEDRKSGNRYEFLLRCA